MIQKPEKGGIFEYCPNIRAPGNENFDEVKKVILIGIKMKRPSKN